MYRDQSLNKQNGAGLPVAIFVITVLALLVIGMAQLQESSGNAVSLQIQSQRAFLAAESGAQVAVTELIRSGSSVPASCAVITTGAVNLSSAGLSGCSAQVVCTDLSASAGVVLVESTGICGIGQDRALRKVEVSLQ